MVMFFLVTSIIININVIIIIESTVLLLGKVTVAQWYCTHLELRL